MFQVVLVTGCSTGIGRDLAQRLTQAGYTVVATARRAEDLSDLQAALKLALDVTQPNSIDEAVARIVQHVGRIDVLVNNAGYALRVELLPFGIQVVLVEPGAIRTHFDKTALAHAQTILSNSASPYRRLYQKSDQFAESMRRQEVGPEAVSRVIQLTIEAPRPKARYLAAVTFSGKLMLLLRDFVWGPVLQRMFKFEPAGTQRS